MLTDEQLSEIKARAAEATASPNERKQAMKRYMVEGIVSGFYQEKDEDGDVVKTDRVNVHARENVTAANEEQAADLALKNWGSKNDWPVDCLAWGYGPMVVLAPEDQQMLLSGAQMLPGMEV